MINHVNRLTFDYVVGDGLAQFLNYVTVVRMETMETFGIKTTQSSLKRNIILRVK